MNLDRQDVSAGFDAQSGRWITGWDHVVQSLQDIFTTAFGARVMREWYGSLVPQALGRPIARGTLLPVLASITSAIEQWEPRFRVISVETGGDLRAGRVALTLLGDYRPRALLGDTTAQGQRRVALAASRDGLQVLI